MRCLETAVGLCFSALFGFLSMHGWVNLLLRSGCVHTSFRLCELSLARVLGSIASYYFREQLPVCPGHLCFLFLCARGSRLRHMGAFAPKQCRHFLTPFHLNTVVLDTESSFLFPVMFADLKPMSPFLSGTLSLLCVVPLVC